MKFLSKTSIFMVIYNQYNYNVIKNMNYQNVWKEIIYRRKYRKLKAQVERKNTNNSGKNIDFR